MDEDMATPPVSDVTWQAATLTRAREPWGCGGQPQNTRFTSGMGAMIVIQRGHDRGVGVRLFEAREHESASGRHAQHAQHARTEAGW